MKLYINLFDFIVYLLYISTEDGAARAILPLGDTMIINGGNNPDNKKTVGGFSTFSMWALAFGCAVGWGSFVMPGTTFLPIAGPLGSALGLLLGAGIMLIIGVNYSRLMNKYPSRGGSCTYAKQLLGGDHGFLCAWMMLLSYSAVIFANCTALSLIIRTFAGDLFCFGFSYDVAGYTVYFGEVLLSFGLIAVCMLFVIQRTLARWVQTIGAVVLFVGICVCFVAVLIHNGGFNGFEPVFHPRGNSAVRIVGIVVLAPWVYIGFESISHISKDYPCSQKKTMGIFIAALSAAALAYIMLVYCASMIQPDGFSSWDEYIDLLGSWGGAKNIPTFYSAQQSMGQTGLMVIGITAVAGIVTAIVGNLIILGRLFSSMSSDGSLLPVLTKQNKKGVPWRAICAVSVAACIIPLLGRTAIGWIVDVTTISAAVVYGYTSVCAFILGRQEHRRSSQVFGLLGTAIAVAFFVIYLWPEMRSRGAIATESFLILIIWCLIGMLMFRHIISRDKTKRFGTSIAVWVILFLLIIIISHSWIYRSTNEEIASVNRDVRIIYENHAEAEHDSPDDESLREISDRISDFADLERRNVFIQDGLILCSLIVIFSIFTITKKREEASEKERLRAEENSRAKSVFLSNMSHDIRTPLNAVMGYTALALQEEDLSDNVRGYLEKIDYSGQHLLSLINDVLDMSRIESGKVELRTLPADLCRIIGESLDIFIVQMREKNLTCDADYGNIQDKYVICDHNRVSRILLNLLSNALKFTPQGGTVTVRLRQLGSENGVGSYELIVADTGIGMSKEFAKRIFDPFERERTQTVSRLQGTGLGMTITKSLVDLMGGKIELETEKNKGTKFTITMDFPLCAAEDVAAEEGTIIEDNASFHSKRLLVTDDNPINVEIASEILRQEGFIVETADNGKTAVEMVENAEPDYYSAVLMDIQMPVMDGYEAAKAIRALDGERSRIPIIAITANTFDSDKKDALEAGMNDHVAKPFRPNDLIKVIGKYLG